MKVLLTGANGFVGSHILDLLRARDIPVTVLLRAQANTSLIQRQLSRVQVVTGGLTDSASVRQALQGATHVIHCAGLTKALRVQEFYEVNQNATRHLVTAINELNPPLERLVLISSLAAAGPANASQPIGEQDAPRPVSEYGKSKLGGEQAVRENCRVPFVILRPPGVYGPRDGEFLRLFKAVKSHLLPTIGGDRQALSLVYVKDLAAAAVHCLAHPAAANQTYFVAADEVVTAGQMAAEIARLLQAWTIPLPLPVAGLWPMAAWQELVSHLTGKANVLSFQKLAELRAPGWVCDASRIKRELGFDASVRLQQGVAETLKWYQTEKWL